LRSEFLEAMATVADGVVLVTCSVDGRAWGVTATSFASVSADPPTVVVSLRTSSTAARAIASSRRYGVVVLGAEHEELARASSVPGAAKFVDGLDDAPARLECDVVRAVVVGDHTVFFGRVAAAWHSGVPSDPLVYHRRRYLWPSS
jgi:flavin reductase (DIM6/NTAB) family NADH-FMN oxidoreductase RutF